MITEAQKQKILGLIMGNCHFSPIPLTQAKEIRTPL